MIILLDIDGVLADFVSASLKLFNREDIEVNRWDFNEQLGLEPQVFWDRISKQGSAFWREIPKTHFADKFIWILRKKGLAEKTIFCSSPSLDPSSAKGKLQWINKHYPGFFRRFILTADKSIFKGDFVLIDDSDENCAKFLNVNMNLVNRPENNCFKVPQLWNSNRHLIEKRVQMFELFVDKLTNEMKGKQS